jgi:hypothetical protein
VSETSRSQRRQSGESSVARQRAHSELNAWRRIVGVLANDDSRAVYARIVLGEPVDQVATGLRERRLGRVIGSLVDSGLVEESDGGLVATGEMFRAMLAAEPVQRATGVERFLRDGRIDRYPAAAGERRELLEWVVTEAFPEDEELDEPAVNERLERFTDDVAVLRRYLVDHELLERTPSGSTYAAVRR